MKSTDILAAIFFVIAGAWLLLAVMYSTVVLIFLRMRARGQLDSIYEADFGRVYLCGSDRYYIPMGFVFRRYLIHLQNDQANHIVQNYRFMTREERKTAMEKLLVEKATTVKKMEAKEKEDEASQTSDEDQHDEEVGEEDSCPGLVCSICLGEYEHSEAVLGATTCSHQFHEDCILDWLSRQANNECPCCRVAMVEEDTVWKTVQKMRKEKQRQLRREKRKEWFMRRNGPTKESEDAQHEMTENESSESSDIDEIPIVETGNQESRTADVLSGLDP